MKKEKSKKVPTKRVTLKQLLAIVGVTLTAMLAFVGCGIDKENKDEYEKGWSQIEHTGQYIVVTENGEETLHRGSYKTEVASLNYGGVSSAVPILKFDCGEIISTSQFVSYLNKKPNATKYDHVCHDCFPDAEIGE